MSIEAVVESIQSGMLFDQIVQEVLDTPLPQEPIFVRGRLVTPDDFQILSHICNDMRTLTETGAINDQTLELINLISTRVTLDFANPLELRKFASLIKNGFSNPEVYKSISIFASLALTNSLFFSCAENSTKELWIDELLLLTWQPLYYLIAEPDSISKYSEVLDAFKTIFKVNFPDPKATLSNIYDKGFNRLILDALVK
jgi:hypothetical protein